MWTQDLLGLWLPCGQLIYATDAPNNRRMSPVVVLSECRVQSGISSGGRPSRSVPARPPTRQHAHTRQVNYNLDIFPHLIIFDYHNILNLYWFLLDSWPPPPSTLLLLTTSALGARVRRDDGYGGETSHSSSPWSGPQSGSAVWHQIPLHPSPPPASPDTSLRLFRDELEHSRGNFKFLV